MSTRLDLSKLSLMDALDLAKLIEMEAHHRYRMFALSSAAAAVTMPEPSSPRWPRTRPSTARSWRFGAMPCSAMPPRG